MLMALMYHRVGEGKHANPLELLNEHFAFLRDNYSIVLPGEPLPKKKLSLCLTFDDASFDFYHHVFPLLKTLQIRAVLGIPVRYILEETRTPPEERLSVPYALAMQDGLFETRAPLCTWKEINEMIHSGWVEAASHSYAHCNLTFPFVDLETEVVLSKKILEKKTRQAVSTFIYPFGKCNRKVHSFVSQHYSFAFRIGSAMNHGWSNQTAPLCRVPGDNMRSPYELLSLRRKLKYFLSSFIIPIPFQELGFRRRQSPGLE